MAVHGTETAQQNTNRNFTLHEVQKEVRLGNGV